MINLDKEGKVTYRAVQEDDVPPPPARLLPVQLLGELVEVDLHDALVGVLLDEAEVHVGRGAQAGYHADARMHQLDRDGVGGAFRAPLASSVVALTKPSILVYVIK